MSTQSIPPVDASAATPQQQEVLDTVKQAMGGVPNLLATMAQSPAVANSYLGFSQTLSGGELSPELRESIALTVGETNSCQYCVAAHIQLGANAGLSAEAITDARRATSADPTQAAALGFAKKLVTERGNVSADDVQSLRNQGFSDGEVAEIVANVALNLFTNYFNHVAQTEVDFPAAPAL
jgi:uncharacterized peroxidase-related enzyme